MRLISLFSALLLFYAINLNCQSIELTKKEGYITITDVLYAIDSTGDLYYEQISDPLFAGNFKKSSPTYLPNSEYKAYWIKFSLKNSTSNDAEWILDFKNWSYVDIYVNDGLTTSILRTGHLLPHSQKSYILGNNNYLDLYIKEGQEATIYGRLDPAFNGFIKPINLHFKVGEKEEFMKNKATSRSISFLFIGVYLVMILYNMFIYISTRDKTYRFYLISLIILLFTVLEVSGLVFEYFSNFDSVPFYSMIWHHIQPVLLTASVLLFVKDFFRVTERYPFWSKLINYLLYYIFSMTALLLVSYDFASLMIVIGVFPFVIIVFSLGIKSYRQGFPGSIYLILGHIFWFIFGIAAMLGQINPWAREQEFFTHHSLFVGSSLEMILFSLALANTINYLKRENEIKQQRIIDHLKENTALQSKVNRELETKVSLRTKEIFEQKEEIAYQKRDLEIEKERAELLLLNILPKVIAEELKKTGQATPRFYEKVSILFVDISKFSLMAKEWTPNELVNDLDYLFSAFDEVVTKNNLEKIKTIGDAYMCVGGLPVKNDSHALDAVNAAFEMIQIMEDWKINRASVSNDQLNLRAGIHTGPVTSGVVGKQKFQFDIWGDAVNLASRMEAGSEPGRINISETAYNEIKHKFNCRFRGTFPAKNMGEVNMYFVESQKS